MIYYMKMKTKKLKDSDYAYYEEYIANKDKLIKVEANIIYLESNGYEFIKEDIKNSKVKIILKNYSWCYFNNLWICNYSFTNWKYICYMDWTWFNSKCWNRLYHIT